LQETAPRKTAENTVKHRDGGVGSVVASHCSGSESMVVVTTVNTIIPFLTCGPGSHRLTYIMAINNHVCVCAAGLVMVYRVMSVMLLLFGA